MVTEPQKKSKKGLIVALVLLLLVAIGGGVAANSELRQVLKFEAKRYGWKVYIPERKYTTDNAAMIAGAGYYKFLKKEFVGMDIAPDARLKF